MSTATSERKSISSGFRYLKLADEMEGKIKNRIFKPGEKLPSLRDLNSQTGLSLSTVYQAYIELEKRELVEPRIKSGFYVKAGNYSPAPETVETHLKPIPRMVSINELVTLFHDQTNDPSILQIGGVVPASSLLPYKKLFRSLVSKRDDDITRMMAGYDNPFGNWELRRQIAKRTLGVSGIKIDPEDILVTNGCMEAINLCLRAVTQPGDTILIESPSYYCFLQLIEDLNLLALEIPSNPERGIDFSILEQAVESNPVNACLLNPNFQHPLGSVIPTRTKKKIVDLMSRKNIPIIEDDVYGELYFGKKRPSTFCAIDREGLVLHCASFSKTLAPGLRVGWTVPGRYMDKVKRLKLGTSYASPTNNQLIVAEFLKSEAYDRHLRRLRDVLNRQMQSITEAILRYFPTGIRITAPKGGLMLWVQLMNQVDALDIWHEASKQNIFFLPGAIFSGLGNYKNCIRIGCGHPLTTQMEEGMEKLGKIIKKHYRN